MKTSDKILIGTILTILGVIAGAQIALYARYKAGIILTDTEIYRRNHLRRELSEPAHLLIRGIYQVHFYKAERFAIEFERAGILRRDIIDPQPEAASKHSEGGQVIIQPRYYRSGDTLVIDGAPPGIKEIGARMLNIFGYAGSSIILEDGSTCLEGDSTGEGHDYQILLKRNRLSLGPDDDISVTARTNNHFHKLTIDAMYDSEFQLGPGIHVGELNIALDSTSSLATADRGWIVDQLHIHPDDQSRLSIDGQFLKKMQEQPASTTGKNSPDQK